MSSTLLIFKGWASDDKLYDNLLNLADDVIISDELFSPELVNKYSRIDNLIILGWSLGAMIALQLSQQIEIKKLILISPTEYFCNSTPKESVNNLIDFINKDKITGIKHFNKINFSNKTNYIKYIKDYSDSFENLDKSNLIRGLEYLRDKIIKIDYNKILIKPLIIYSKKDKVINYSNSLKIADSFKEKEIIEIDSGHNILYEYPEIVSKIRSYIID